MAEVKSLPIIETHYPVQRAYKPRKRWIAAMESSKFRQKKVHNECVEIAYHSLITCVKKRLLKPGETYFERDHKTDTSDGIFGMHSFMTASFYLWLECDLSCDYRVHFAFNNCSLEYAIRLTLKAFPMNHAATEIRPQPDFDTYYNNMLKVQDKRFIFTH